MTSKNIAILYQLINKEFGFFEARRTVEAVISNAISDLQQAGKEISPENIDLEVERYTRIFIEASSDLKSA